MMHSNTSKFSKNMFYNFPLKWQGGESFFIVDKTYGDKSSLATYVSLTDTFREIQRRTMRNSPALVS